jgi:hypothetical protein
MSNSPSDAPSSTCSSSTSERSNTVIYRLAVIGALLTASVAAIINPPSPTTVPTEESVVTEKHPSDVPGSVDVNQPAKDTKLPTVSKIDYPQKHPGWEPYTVERLLADFRDQYPKEVQATIGSSMPRMHHIDQ